MLWNSRRIWLLLWLTMVMAIAGARPALAQSRTEQVDMSDATRGDFEFYDAVNKTTIGPDGLACTDRVIPNNNDPTDPNFSANQFCATSIIRVGDKVQWNPPPQLAGQHGTETGSCVMGLCSGNPPGTPDWMDTSQFTDPPFVVPGSAGVAAGFTFNTAAVFPYFCTVHLSAMTGTVIVQDYSLVLSGDKWAYVSSPATFNGTATAAPNATIPANGASAAYSNSVLLTANGVALNEQPPSPGSLTPTVAGTPFTVTDTGENSVQDVQIEVNGIGNDASHLTHNSNVPLLHVVQLTMGAISPSSVTIAPTDAVGKTATFSVTDNGTFPGSLTPACSGVPAGVTCNFTPVTAGTHTITMTVTTSGVVPGNYPASVVIAPGGSLANCGPGGTPSCPTFTLVVAAFNAVLSSPSNQIIPPGGTATFNGTVTSVGGYSGSIAFTCQPAAPAGATCPGAGSTTPVALSSGGSSPFTVNFVDTTFLGTDSFNIVATGTPGTVVDTLPVTVSVGGFTLGNPSITTIGDTIGNPSQTMTFQITPTGAFNTAVTLSCIGGAAPSFPAGATCKFYPSNVITLSGSAVTVTLVVTTTSATAANTYNFNVQGVGGGSTQTITGGLKLNVMAGAASIDLSVAGGGEVISPGPVQLAGTPLTFKYVITNTNGTSTATTATALISFTVPVSSPQFGGTSGACSGSGSGPYTCPVASIAANGSRTVSATITTPFVRSMTASVQVSSPDTDTNQANNTATSLVVPIRLRPFARKGLPAKLP